MRYIGKKVKLSDLKVDMSYQRPIDLKRVNRIFKMFNSSLVDQPKVSERENGDLYIIDGQHTVALCKKKWGSDAELTCRVYKGLSLEEEAQLWHDCNTNKKTPTSNEKLVAKYAAKDPFTLNYVETLTKSGIEWSFAGGKKMTCHSGAIKALKKYGNLSFYRALKFLSECWDTSDGMYTKEHIQGMTALFAQYYDQIDLKRLKRKLKEKTKEDFKRMANEAGSSQGGNTTRIMNAYACAFARVYNERLRSNTLDTMPFVAEVNK